MNIKQAPTEDFGNDINLRIAEILKSIINRDEERFKAVMLPLVDLNKDFGDFPRELLSKNNSLNCDDLSFYIRSANANQVTAIFNYIESFFDDGLDAELVEHFVLESSNVLEEKVRNGLQNGSYSYSRHYLLLFAMARCCLNFDILKTLKIALKVIKITNSRNDDQNLLHLQTCIKLNLLLDGSDTSIDKEPMEKAKYIENLGTILATLSEVKEVAPTRLINRFQHNLTLLNLASGESLPVMVSEPIRVSMQNVLSEVQTILGGKSVQAISLFGNRQSKMSSPLILNLMKEFGERVSASSLPVSTKKAICNDLVRVALEGKTNFMPVTAIQSIIASTTDYSDYGNIVPRLNNRGTKNLLDCVPDSSPYVHLLKRHHRGLALSNGLAL